MRTISFGKSNYAKSIAILLSYAPSISAYSAALGFAGEIHSSQMSSSSAEQRPINQVTEKIIGESDLTPVNFRAENLPSELRPLVEAFGQLNVGCTGTHVGGGLVLTAGHCVSTSPRSSSSSCHLLGIVWGNRGGNKSLSVSKCIAIKARVYNSSVDFALIQVSNPPSAFINIDFESLNIRQAITMFSFPHMRPLEWSGECELRPHDDPTKLVNKFLHTCDSENGSSGAAVIARDSLKIIGIHGGSSDDLNYGTLTTSMQAIKNLLTE